jgi:hypothetical protein
MAWVREWTVLTKQPPLVGEVSANFNETMYSIYLVLTRGFIVYQQFLHYEMTYTLYSVSTIPSLWNDLYSKTIKLDNEGKYGGGKIKILTATQ